MARASDRRRARAARIAAEQGVRANAPVEPLPAPLLEQRTFRYDASAYAFAETVRRALRCDDLETLHETDEGRAATAAPPRSGRDPFSKRWMLFLDALDRPSAMSAELDALRAALRRFVRERVADACAGHGWAGEYAYQARPSLRVHLPHTRALGVPHCDRDYYHQPSEINFWIPLTRVYGSNSLTAESAPGRGDFAPFEAGPGEFVRFYGNGARHYTVENTTPLTRVSLDIRVVPRARFVPDWRAPDGAVRFRLHQYYASSWEEEGAAAADGGGGGADGLGRGAGAAAGGVGAGQPSDGGGGGGDALGRGGAAGVVGAGQPSERDDVE
jgi:hypothetical protein